MSEITHIVAALQAVATAEVALKRAVQQRDIAEQTLLEATQTFDTAATAVHQAKTNLNKVGRSVIEYLKEQQNAPDDEPSSNTTNQ